MGGCLAALPAIAMRLRVEAPRVGWCGWATESPTGYSSIASGLGRGEGVLFLEHVIVRAVWFDWLSCLPCSPSPPRVDDFYGAMALVKHVVLRLASTECMMR